MEYVLEINNLQKKYGGYSALNDVSLRLPKGCITGLLGPNGSGKTTLIKIITGLITDYQGQVQVAGLPPGPEACSLISYLPDKSALPDWLKASETVNLYADFYQDFDRKKALDMLESMKLPLRKPIKSLSKGMQEKLQLALVMSRNAVLYILDEPIAAVDPASRDFIMGTILNNCAEGSAILLSTHIISDIEPALDRAIFLKDGAVILHEEVEALRAERQISIDALFREVFRC